MSEKADVVLTLTHDEALVLFEWLAREDEKGAIPTEHPAERVALWRVQGQLESTLVEPFLPDYLAIVAAARERVSPKEGGSA